MPKMNAAKIMSAAAPRLAQVLAAQAKLRRKYPGLVLVKTGAGTSEERVREGQLSDVWVWRNPVAHEDGVTAAGLGCKPNDVRVLPRHALLEVRELEAKIKRLHQRRARLIAATWHGSSLLDLDLARKISAERQKLEAR